MTPCIEHTQAKPKYGTGYYNGKYTSLHRCKYVKHHNLGWDDVAGLEVMHKCDNPRCINIEHLSLGTRSDNTKDCHSKGRAANNLRNWDQKANRKRGEQQTNSRWTDEQIKSIRSEYAGGAKQVHIAAKYGCRQSDISRIVRRNSWSHIT